MSDLQQNFLQFAFEKDILKFGSFQTKFGRQSPYFFNAGLFYEGSSLHQLAHFYADTIIQHQIEFDVLFGPAYKGIVLAAATSIALYEKGINRPFAYNRQEKKDHGEKGSLVGAPLKNRVLIIDDVISAGTSVRESIEIITHEKATPAGVLVALDRMERGFNEQSAVDEIKDKFNIPVTAIANLKDLLKLVGNNPDLQQYQASVEAYRKQYGVE